jgi:hypothetical protein
MTETITVFRSGAFTTEPRPGWMAAVHDAAKTHGDWDKALRHVLGLSHTHVRVGDDIWVDAEVSAYCTPGGGYLIDMMAGDTGHAEVWLPDPADWLPFHTAHVEPFLQARAAIRQNDRIDRLANVLIAWARHGDGKHIDRLTGESRIDQREDWKRHQRDRDAMRSDATATAISSN